MVISHNFRIGLTTILWDVCPAIWQNIKLIAPPLTMDRWNEVGEGYQKYAQFPNCIDAIDGKHIRIKAIAHSGSLYFNYNLIFSVVFKVMNKQLTTNLTAAAT